MDVGSGFCCRTRYARRWGFHLQARVWGALGARGGGVWDAVIGRVLAFGLRAELSKKAFQLIWVLTGVLCRCS